MLLPLLVTPLETVGSRVGREEGDKVGRLEGKLVGSRVGRAEGEMVGFLEGRLVG